MTTEYQKPFSELLEKLGFEALPRANSTVWRFAVDTSEGAHEVAKVAETPAKKNFSLWLLKSCEFTERKGHFSILNADLTLNFTHVTKRMSSLERKFWGQKIVSDYVETSKSTCWCLYEFLKNVKNKGDERRRGSEASYIAKDSISGMGGYQAQLTVSGGQVSLLLSDHFGLGYMPPGFIQTALLFTAESFGFRDKRLSALNIFPNLLSIHEWRIPAPTLLFRALLDECEKDLDTNLLVDLWAQVGDARGIGRADFVYDSLGCHLKLGNSEDIRSLPYFSTHIPNEVLESREKQEAFGQIDVALFQGKYDLATNLVEEYLAESSADLYLLRRLALLGLTGHRDSLRYDSVKLQKDFEQINRAIETETDNKLLLSDFLRMSQFAQDSNIALGILSKLGELLSSQIPNVEGLRTFDVVIVEMLGDLWLTEDPQKAEDCYLRILQKKGEIQRVLRKLVQLMRINDRVEGEQAYLERLARVERRHSELANIKFRLAEIKSLSLSQREEAVELALGALKLDRSLVEAAFLAAEVLVKLGRPDEAIHLLDTRVSDQVKLENIEKISKNQEIIGKIWLESRSRADLALPRYEKAVELDPSNISAIRVLEKLYRDKNDHKNLAKTIESEIFLVGNNISSARLKELFDEIVSLFRGPLANPKRAYDVYLRLVAIGALDPLEIERVMRWDDVPIDWNNLYDRLLEARFSIPSGERKGRFLSKMAEIAGEKLGFDGVATQHLRDALEEGWIDSRGFALLTQDLRGVRDFDALAIAYEKRIGMLSDQDQVALIQEYFEIPYGIDDLKRDQLAIRCFSLDSSQESLVNRRLAVYRDHEDLEGIYRIFSLIVSINDLTQFQKSKWADICLDILSDCSSEQRFVFAHKIFTKKFEYSEDVIELLRQAVRFFKEAADLSLLQPYLKQLLSAQRLPELDQKIVEKVLHGHALEMALYERLLAIYSANPESSASHARISARIFLKLRNLNSAEEMLARVCMITPCSENDLAELSDMANVTGNWQLIARCYEAQIKFEDEKNRKLNLVFSLARIYREKLGEFENARKIVQYSMELTSESLRAKKELAEIALASGDVETQELTIVAYLYESQSVKAFDEFERYFNHLASNGLEKNSLQRIVISHLDYALKKSRWNVISRLVELSSVHRMSHWYIFKVAFLSGLNEGKLDGLAECWWRGLATVPHLTKAVGFIGETITAAKSFGHMSLVIECFETALRRNVLDRLGPHGKKEILLSYAALLFDDDDRRERSLQIYQEVYRLDPVDPRSWLPLYFALSGFGRNEETQAHLEAILPLLIEDPTPLKSFPVTIEFLQEELTRMRQSKGVGGRSSVQRGQRVSEVAGWMAQPALGDVPYLFGKKSNQIARDIELPPLPDLGRAATPLVRAGSEILPKKVVGQGDESAYLEDLGSALPPILLGDNLGHNSPHGGEGEQQSRLRSRDLEGIVGVASIDDALKMPESHEMPLGVGQSFEAGGAALDLADLVDGKNLNDEPELRLVSAANAADARSQSGLDALGLDLSQPFPEERALNEQANVSNGSIEYPKVKFEGPAPVQIDPINRKDDLRQIEPQSPLGVFVSGETDDSKSLGSLGEDVSPQVASLSLDPIELVGIASSDDLTALTVNGSGSSLAFSKSRPKREFGGGDFGDSGESIQTSILDSSKSTGEDDSSTSSGGARVPLEQSVSVALSAEIGGKARMLVRRDLQEEEVNWRQVILTGDFNSDLTNRLLVKAFTSELEKHVAIQSVALVAGNVDLLEEGWHWRVWRHPKEYGYPLVGKERFPRNASSPLLQGSLLKLIISLSPHLVQAFPMKFGLEYLGKRLNTQPRTIEKLRKPLAWDQGFLESVGLHHFANILKMNYQVFNIPGLGVEIFYDESLRSFYFDEVYYSTRPPSHFFNRFLIVLMMVMGRFSVPLKLHPQKDLHFILGQIKDHLFRSRISQIKHSLMADKSVWGRYLVKVDTSFLRSYFEKRGVPSVELIRDTLQAAQIHIYQRVLAETLDVIGFFEAYVNRDFFSDPLGHSEILNLSPKIRPLLEFITKLRV